MLHCNSPFGCNHREETISRFMPTFRGNQIYIKPGKLGKKPPFF